MAFSRIKQKDTANSYYTEYVMDKESDLADLPVQPECDTGSVAICITTSNVYQLNSKGKWVLLGEEDSPTPPSPGGTTNYNDLINKPRINGVEVIGNKTLDYYGYNAVEVIKVNGVLQEKENNAVDIHVPTDNNELSNGAGYVTREVVNDILDDRLVVSNHLPASGIANVRYLITNTFGTYDEYRWNETTSQFELVSTKNTLYYKTTTEWNSTPDLVSLSGVLYIYSDRQGTPGVKIGDGSTKVSALPFLDENINTHMSNNDIHVTLIDKTKWNEKVTCYIDPLDSKNLMFTKN